MRMLLLVLVFAVLPPCSCLTLVFRRDTCRPHRLSCGADGACFGYRSSISVRERPRARLPHCGRISSPHATVPECRHVVHLTAPPPLFPAWHVCGTCACLPGTRHSDVDRGARSRVEGRRAAAGHVHPDAADAEPEQPHVHAGRARHGGADVASWWPASSISKTSVRRGPSREFRVAIDREPTRVRLLFTRLLPPAASVVELLGLADMSSAGVHRAAAQSSGRRGRRWRLRWQSDSSVSTG